MKVALSAILFLAGLTPDPGFAEGKKELLFSQAFKDGRLGSSVVVQVPAGTILVFDGGTYDLDGRDLVIAADQAAIRANTIVRAFDPKSVPSTVSGAPPAPSQTQGTVPCQGRNGCDGVPGSSAIIGAKGATGRSGGREVFEVTKLTNSDGAQLTLSAGGQKGGRGQQGAPGGRGAIGGTGSDAGEVPHCDTPGGGGTGGQGGPPGPGGVGGDGGAGGIIEFPMALRSNKVILAVGGGAGGDPGEKGVQGLGGQGGARGSGSRTCSQDPPDPAHDGPLGPIDPTAATPPSIAGPPGKIVDLL
jgi:hypothetical protein